MPKFGLKCFVGSFLLSLAAVFAATKAYLVMSAADYSQTNTAVNEIKPRNIELFASNEENDAIYEKFKQLEKNGTENKVSEQKENAKDVSADNADKAEILEEGLLIADDDAFDEVIVSAENEETANEILVAENDTTTAETSTEITSENEELQIADASEAPKFTIPLMHNFVPEDVQNIAISSEASDSQVAFTPGNVALNNLGLKKQAAVTDEAQSVGYAQSDQSPYLDSPWDVAETGNKYAAKNALSSSNDQPKTEQQQDVQTSQENKVAYKMQKNLLIPIPEEIANDRNLTPQFSSSAENKKLEEELRANKTLPSLDNTGTNNGANSEDESDILSHEDIPDLDDQPTSKEDEAISKSLSDSIAEWFSSAKPKTSADDIKSKDKRGSASDALNNNDQNNSIFSKLLGAGKKNVTPTELKLSFQPNRAEISGQTLDWIKAFADNAVKYENVVVEIRIAKSAPYELQQKRLRLLYRILANNGVDYSKVNMLFTDREPNSFIIRNVRYATEEEKAKNVKTYNPWY
ncbi:MAG: hypothetical protein MJ212_00450 [Alphaproteobacteria bacterium]|nr:hypothetical protein [Alphaproteobacteria bacterium]